MTRAPHSLQTARYDYIHLPLDHQTHKNMSLAFLNFSDHEAALAAFASLSRPSDFPEAFAPSTKVVWGAIHGLGPNLAHFLARYGRRALDPPYAPLVFQNGICVPRTQDILQNLGNTFGSALPIVCLVLATAVSLLQACRIPNKGAKCCFKTSAAPRVVTEFDAMNLYKVTDVSLVLKFQKIDP